MTGLGSSDFMELFKSIWCHFMLPFLFKDLLLLLLMLDSLVSIHSCFSSIWGVAVHLARLKLLSLGF